MSDLLTRNQIIFRVKAMKLGVPFTHSPFNAPVRLPNVPDQQFFVLRVDEANEAHYTRVLGYYPISRK